MTSSLTIFFDWCLTLPHFPVQFLRNFGDREWAACGRTVDTYGDVLNITEQTLLHHVYRSHEFVAVTTLLSSYKKR